MPHLVDERETSLVIDHAIAKFHITSNRKSLANHLRKLAVEYRLDMADTQGHVTLSNVPVYLLSKLKLATYSTSKLAAKTDVDEQDDD